MMSGQFMTRDVDGEADIIIDGYLSIGGTRLNLDFIQGERTFSIQIDADLAERLGKELLVASGEMRVPEEVA